MFTSQRASKVSKSLLTTRNLQSAKSWMVELWGSVTRSPGDMTKDTTPNELLKYLNNTSPEAMKQLYIIASKTKPIKAPKIQKRHCSNNKEQPSEPHQTPKDVPNGEVPKGEVPKGEPPNMNYGESVDGGDHFRHNGGPSSGEPGPFRRALQIIEETVDSNAHRYRNTKDYWQLFKDIFNRVFQGGQSDPSVAGLVGASHFGLSMFITPFNTHVMRGFLFGQNFFPKARLSWCIPAVVCILSAPLYNGNRRGKFLRNKVFAMNEAKFWSGEVWRPFTQALYPRSWTSSWWMIACMFPFCLAIESLAGMSALAITLGTIAFSSTLATSAIHDGRRMNDRQMYLFPGLAAFMYMGTRRVGLANSLKTAYDATALPLIRKYSHLVHRQLKWAAILYGCLFALPVIRNWNRISEKGLAKNATVYALPVLTGGALGMAYAAAISTGISIIFPISAMTLVLGGLAVSHFGGRYTGLEKADLLRAFALARQRKCTEALSILDSVARAHRGRSELVYLQGQISYTCQRYGQSLQAAERLLAKQPSNVNYGVLRSRSLLKLGRHEAAVASALKILRRHRYSQDAMLTVAEGMIAMRQYKRAVPYVSALLRLNPQNKRAQRLALILRKRRAAQIKAARARS